MLRDEWDALALVIEHGWHGDFDDDASEVYFALLSGYSAGQVQSALRSLLRAGSKFTPKAGEIIGMIEQRHAPPSFAEAWPVIARATRRLFVDYDRLLEEVRQRAGEFAAGWVASYGVHRLLMEPVNGEHGGAVLHRLGLAYAELASTETGRERTVAALANGGLRLDRGLRKPDFLALANGGGSDERTVFGFTEAEAERVRRADDARRALVDG